MAAEDGIITMESGIDGGEESKKEEASSRDTSSQDAQQGCNFDLGKIIAGLLPWADWLSNIKPDSELERQSSDSSHQTKGCLKLYNHFEYPAYDRHSAHFTFLQLRAGRRPLNVVVVLDGNKAMSMHGKLELSRLAFKLLIQRFSEYDVVALCTWDSGITAYPPINVTVEGLNKLESFIDGVHPPTAPESQCTLSRAIDIGLKRLNDMSKGNQESLSALVLITDGGDPPKKADKQRGSLTTSNSPIPAAPFTTPARRTPAFTFASSSSTLISTKSKEGGEEATPKATDAVDNRKTEMIGNVSSKASLSATTTLRSFRKTHSHSPRSQAAVNGDGVVGSSMTEQSITDSPALSRQKQHQEKLVATANIKQLLANHSTNVPVFVFEVGGSKQKELLKQVIDKNGGYYHIANGKDVEKTARLCAKDMLRASGENAVVTFETTGVGIEVMEVIASPITVEMIQPRTKYSVYLGDIDGDHPQHAVFRVSLPRTSSGTTTVGRAWLEYQEKGSQEDITNKEISIKTESSVVVERPNLDATNSYRMLKRDHFLTFLVLKHRVPLCIDEAYQIMNGGDYNQAKIMLESLAADLRRFDMECSHENNGIIVHPMMKDVKNALTQVGEEKALEQSTLSESMRRRSSVLAGLTAPTAVGGTTTSSSSGGGGRRATLSPYDTSNDMMMTYPQSKRPSSLLRASALAIVASHKTVSISSSSTTDQRRKSSSSSLPPPIPVGVSSSPPPPSRGPVSTEQLNSSIRRSGSPLMKLGESIRRQLSRGGSSASSSGGDDVDGSSLDMSSSPLADHERGGEGDSPGVHRDSAERDGRKVKGDKKARTGLLNMLSSTMRKTKKG